MKKKVIMFLALSILGSSISLAASNGCGTGWNTKWVRDSYGSANFTHACNLHDECYETCGTTRKECDKQFRSRMKRECRSTYTSRWHTLQKNACLKVTDGYYAAVKKNGSDPFRNAQKICR